MWIRLLSFVLCGLVLVQTSAASSLLGSRIGADRTAGVWAKSGGLTTFAMASLNAGWDARFTADSVLDVLAVSVTWTTVSAAGAVSIRIETDDGTGKPSGTLYDANAVLTGQVPVAGTRTYTFAVAPTTGLVIGTLYHAVILTTTGGTTMTLGSHVVNNAPDNLPTQVLNAADGTTRSNFALVTSATPAIMLTRTGPVFKSFAVMAIPFNNTASSSNIFGTTAAGAKIVTQATLSVIGYSIDNLNITVSVAGDLRVRLFDGTDTVVAGSTVIIDKDVVLTTRGMQVPLGTAISITAGTYHLILDSASSADSGHCYLLKGPTAMDATTIPNATLTTGTLDGSGNLSGSWTETSTVQVPLALLIDGITLPAAIQGAGGIIGG